MSINSTALAVVWLYTARTKPMIGRTFYGHAQIMYKYTKTDQKLTTMVVTVVYVNKGTSRKMHEVRSHIK